MDKQNNEEVRVFARTVATELTETDMEKVSGGYTVWYGPGVDGPDTEYFDDGDYN